MSADGSNPTRLIHTAHGDYWWPVWSPNGQRIAVTVERDGDGNSEIYVMSADGSNLTRLIQNTDYAYDDPVWSPDGQRIAFVSDHDGNEEIYVVSAASGCTIDSELVGTWTVEDIDVSGFSGALVEYAIRSGLSRPRAEDLVFQSSVFLDEDEDEIRFNADGSLSESLSEFSWAGDSWAGAWCIEDDMLDMGEGETEYFLDGDELTITSTKTTLLSFISRLAFSDRGESFYVSGEYERLLEYLMRLLEPFDKDYVLTRLILKRRTG